MTGEYELPKVSRSEAFDLLELALKHMDVYAEYAPVLDQARDDLTACEQEFAELLVDQGNYVKDKYVTAVQEKRSRGRNDPNTKIAAAVDQHSQHQYTDKIGGTSADREAIDAILEDDEKEMERDAYRQNLVAFSHAARLARDETTNESLAVQLDAAFDRYMDTLQMHGSDGILWTYN